jgi:negative regulator of sigma E activity
VSEVNVERQNNTNQAAGSSDELLSRLMDGELDEVGLARLFKMMDQNPSLREKWLRFNSTRLHIQGAHLSSPSLSFANRVRDSLQGRKQRRSLRRVMAPLKPFAVAATVACIGVLVGQQLTQRTTQPLALAGSPVPIVRSMPVIPFLEQGSVSVVPASFGQSAAVSAPSEVPVESLYQELARQRLEAYSGVHALRGALHTPVTLMTGSLARADSRSEQP